MCNFCCFNIFYLDHLLQSFLLIRVLQTACIATAACWVHVAHLIQKFFIITIIFKSFPVRVKNQVVFKDSESAEMQHSISSYS